MTLIDRQFTTKGLFVVPHGENKFRLVDIHGCSSLPIEYSGQDDFRLKLNDVFRVKPLIPLAETEPLDTPNTFRWNELEFYFIAHIGYALKRYLMTEEELVDYHASSMLIPLGYAEFGHGHGAREDFEQLDKEVRSAIKSGVAPITAETLEKWLILFEASRVCSEVMSLIHRAIFAFHDLLTEQRNCIADATFAIGRMSPQNGMGEVVNSSKGSYRAASAVVASAISLCTSLDILSKLIFLIEGIDRDRLRYKPAGAKEFARLLKNFHRVPKNIPEELMNMRFQDEDLMQLIQFRHDAIHSGAILDLENVYAGVGTGEINGAALHYSFQPWRSCKNGQPERYLGREYFIANNYDVEHRIFTWIEKIVDIHVSTGKKLHDYLRENAK